MDPGVVIGVVLGITALGFAARMVIRAAADGIARVKAAGHPPVQPSDPAQAQRMAQMEAEIAALKDELGRLSAVEDFYAKLQAPATPARPGSTTGGQ